MVNRIQQNKLIKAVKKNLIRAPKFKIGKSLKCEKGKMLNKIAQVYKEGLTKKKKKQKKQL